MLKNPAVLSSVFAEAGGTKQRKKKSGKFVI
jgi:hypothetical protein